MDEKESHGEQRLRCRFRQAKATARSARPTRLVPRDTSSVGLLLFARSDQRHRCSAGYAVRSFELSVGEPLVPRGSYLDGAVRGDESSTVEVPPTGGRGRMLSRVSGATREQAW